MGVYISVNKAKKLQKSKESLKIVPGEKAENKRIWLKDEKL